MGKSSIFYGNFPVRYVTNYQCVLVANKIPGAWIRSDHIGFIPIPKYIYIYICIYIYNYIYNYIYISHIYPIFYPKCFMVFPPFETHISYQLPWDSKRWAPPWAVEAAPRCSWQQRSPCFSQVPVGYTHSH